MKISDLNGVGAKRAHALNLAGIYTVSDLLNHFPRDYDDRSQIKTVGELILDAVNTIRGVVATEPENAILSRKNASSLNITKIAIKDHTGTLEIIWFNQPYLKKYFKKDSEYIFTGKVRTMYGGRIQMQSPDYEPCGGADNHTLSGGRIVPVYTTPKQFSQKTFRALIFQALDAVQVRDAKMQSHFNESGRALPRGAAGFGAESHFDEYLPASLREKYGLIERKTAVQNIHFPESNEKFLSARHRLVFEELFFIQRILLNLKESITTQPGVPMPDVHFQPLLDNLPFALTSAQSNVLSEIAADLASGGRMNRLIQGDVGSGKTAIALAVAYVAMKNGYQAALMAPTDVLANQHLSQCEKYFQPLGFETVLLTGSIGVRARREALTKIESGKTAMVVGTHALFQDGVVYNNLGLVITDEQHRFGVDQRLSLMKKGEHPHTLVMTATPIPRTLGMILYGDLDISIINALPPGRQTIKTYCVDSRYRERLHNFIRKEVFESRQTYIICPAIQESENMSEKETPKAELQNVLNYTQELSAALPDLSISYLHGKMRPTEKQQTMDDFKQGKIQVIVSTTVIEVGIHVPNATLIIIENAERFGLSQLHQLRGRVGRGDAQSYCVLLTDTKNDETKARMKAMTDTSDGFKLAELDLKLRGAGDFFGTRQHGLPSFSIANLYKDMDILKQAQSAAVEQFEMSPAEAVALEKRMVQVLATTRGGVM